ncbi:MAG: lysoplasmalogenase [Erysipelotrichaceae bacterium]|nr:lysoplasmalogenase [Erysipelotrichaceae bacterium]
MTLFVAVYLIALFCYFFTRVSKNIMHRAINKYIMATMYLVLAIVTFFRKYEFVSYQALYMVALLFAYFGDLFLVFDFGRGGDFFLAGNICFIVYEQIVMIDHGLSFKDFWWVFLTVAVILGTFIIACTRYPEKIKMGKMRWPMTWYLSTILTHGITGLALIILLPGTNFVTLGMGSFLFMISDMILTAYRFIFNDNKWLIRANSLTYFVGLLLIVLSMV